MKRHNDKDKPLTRIGFYYNPEKRHPYCSLCGKMSVVHCTCAHMSWGFWRSSQVPVPVGTAFVIKEESVV